MKPTEQPGAGTSEAGRCPGCGVARTARSAVAYDGYFNTSPECWAVFGEVMAAEFGNAVVFGQAHQLSVDTYAVQHAGGAHPDKSVAVHLAGLYLVLELDLKPPRVPPQLRRLAARNREWPHFPPPTTSGELTALDVAAAGSPEDHVRIVREWSREVWAAWEPHHPAVAELVARHLDLERLG